MILEEDLKVIELFIEYVDPVLETMMLHIETPIGSRRSYRILLGL